jgi:Ca-activated chloride channel homolog
MPGRDITRQRNKVARVIVFLTFAFGPGLRAAAPAAAAHAWLQNQAQPSQTQPNQTQPANPASPPQSSPPPASPQSSGAAAAPPATAAPTQQNSGKNSDAKPDDRAVFVIRKDVDEVMLHASVVDDKQHIVTNLDRGSFTVFEDGKQQTIVSFRNEDIPVAMGIVIDNSGSMREKRSKVNQAALNLVRSSNPRDEVFIVNFNDEYYLDQDFTNDLLKLKDALEKIASSGGTALYDAVVASADHLKRYGRLERKVIFVVTDGEDNASNENLEQAVKQLQEENGPSVYAIGILGEEEHPKRARRALEILAQRTGGIAFFPKTLDEVDAISRTVAHDIRNQYTIGYKPTNPRGTGGFRTVRVEARGKGHTKMTVRTKSGYYAGPPAAATGGK